MYSCSTTVRLYGMYYDDYCQYSCTSTCTGTAVVGRAYGSMQVNSGQTDTHFRCQKHRDNAQGLSQIQSSHRTREERNKRSGKQFTEAAKRSSVSGDASGNQRILRSRTMDALITVIGGRWRDVWREEKQRYYNLGYEDCSKGGQKRKFTQE
jgi:hypothetical protein